MKKTLTWASYCPETDTQRAFSRITLGFSAVDSRYQEKNFFPTWNTLYLIEFFGHKFFVKCLNEAGIFLNFIISDQKLAKSSLVLARKNFSWGARTRDLPL